MKLYNVEFKDGTTIQAYAPTDVVRFPVKRFNYYIRRGWIKWIQGPYDGSGCGTHCKWRGIVYSWLPEFPVGGQVVALTPVNNA